MGKAKRKPRGKSGQNLSKPVAKPTLEIGINAGENIVNSSAHECIGSISENLEKVKSVIGMASDEEKNRINLSLEKRIQDLVGILR